MSMEDQQHENSTSKKQGRVIYDDPSANPKESLHWKRLQVNPHNFDGSNNNIIRSHDELLHIFQRDVDSLKHKTNEQNYQILALWSCIIGYCEALSTHKDATRRYALFPIPLDDIRRLVDDGFIPLLNSAQDALNNTKSEKSSNNSTTSTEEGVHRETVRAVANAIWKRAQNKNSSMQDELHANSLYTCLCGDVDSKSLDCFGSTLLVVLGMNILGFSSSCLTLSEDHAYETHLNDTEEINGVPNRATCEVAIPGNTKAAQSKRGKEVAFEQLKRGNSITPETSWLYMHGKAVVCDTPGMVLAAMVGNMNCDIDKQKPGAIGDGSKPQVVSKQLYKMKRDMLWILLHDHHMTKFPFAIMELGECEEHLSSPKGMELVDVSNMLNCKGIEVLQNEKLFLDAIHISKTVYGDTQIYPYLYCAHYHRDAGRDDESEEYRLVESLRLYAEATRVASGYKYDTKDCMQLMKHFTTVAALISKDILLLQSDDGGNGKVKAARSWQRRENAVAAATWLFGFFDSLLFWEENEHNAFVEILSIQHKHSLSKLFQLLDANVRKDAIAKIHVQEQPYSNDALAITEEQLIYFRCPRSRRLAQGSLLLLALSKEKVVVRELEMALPSNEGRSSRQRKRART